MTRRSTIAGLFAGIAAMAAFGTPASAYYPVGPDLVIESVELYATGKCNYLQPAIVGDIVIRNRGAGRAKALWVSPIVNVYDANDRRFRDAEVKINSLAPGESVRTRIRIGSFTNKRDYFGNRLIRIKADPRGQITEDNEKNNTLSVRVRTDCH